jgi:hypothetical protein
LSLLALIEPTRFVQDCGNSVLERLVVLPELVRLVFDKIVDEPTAARRGNLVKGTLDRALISSELGQLVLQILGSDSLHLGLDIVPAVDAAGLFQGEEDQLRRDVLGSQILHLHLVLRRLLRAVAHGSLLLATILGLLWELVLEICLVLARNLLIHLEID